MKKHNVHLYCVVRVKVLDVEAAKHDDACAIADCGVSGELHKFLNREGPWVVRNPDGTEFTIADAEFAEEVVSYLVDEVGDEDFVNSTHHKPWTCSCLNCQEQTDFPIERPDSALGCPACGKNMDMPEDTK